MLYGSPPRDIGFVRLEPTEMMFWLYCPISTPTLGANYRAPDNLLAPRKLERNHPASVTP